MQEDQQLCENQSSSEDNQIGVNQLHEPRQKSKTSAESSQPSKRIPWVHIMKQTPWGLVVVLLRLLWLLIVWISHHFAW
jgi:hypothetical protein